MKKKIVKLKEKIIEIFWLSMESKINLVILMLCILCGPSKGLGIYYFIHVRGIKLHKLDEFLRTPEGMIENFIFCVIPIWCFVYFIWGPLIEVIKIKIKKFLEK